MKSKNVLIITDYAAPYEGNFIMSLKKLEKSIIEDGGEFYYFFQQEAKNINWVNKMNNYHFFDKNILNNIKIFNNFIKRNNIDIVYSHFCLPKTQLAIKITRMLNKNINLVQHFHNHYELPNNIIKKLIFRFIFKGDINIGCSKSVMESLPYKNKCYVNNGIDFSRLDEYENIEFENDTFKILMFGYTYERKGVDLAIKAIKKLNNEKVILAISMSKGVDELKELIQKDFGTIPEFVRILEPRNDIATYYRNVDLFISPSREEGLCYSPIEAMYCGTACICSNIPGHSLDIPGLVIFEKEDINCLSKSIEKIIKFKNFDSKKAKKFIKTNYNVENWSKNIKMVITNEK